MYGLNLFLSTAANLFLNNDEMSILRQYPEITQLHVRRVAVPFKEAWSL